MSKVNINEVIEIPSFLEVLTIVLEIEKETNLTQHRMLIFGDINLDQILPEHVAKVDPLIQNLSQC